MKKHILRTGFNRRITTLSALIYNLPVLLYICCAKKRSFLCAAVALILLVCLAPLPAYPQTPVAINGAPSASFAGEQFDFDVDLTNTGGPGFGPYHRLILPPDITFDSATYLGSGITTNNLGTFNSASGNQLTDPRTGSIVTGPEGGTLILLVLPLGSVVQGGPAITTNIYAMISTAAIVGVPLDITVQPIYELGDTATGVNGPIEGTARTAQVTPTVVTITKAQAVAEGERVPGPVFRFTYTLTVDVANGKSVFDLVIDDVLPINMQFVGPVTIIGGIDGVATVTPSTLTPGGTITVACSRVDGATTNSDMTISFPVYITDILDETNCSTQNLINTATLNCKHPDNTPLPQLSDNATVTARHLAIQKGAAPASSSPGNTITFTCNFQVSEYATADNLVITDILPDGFTFASHLSLTVNGGPMVITPVVTPNGDGTTTIIYNVDAVTGDLGPAATGTLVYTATINQDYTPGPDPILASDSLTNTINGAYSLTAGAAGCNDDSGATVSILPVTITKTIVNVQTEYVPGETITFRLELEVPSGDTKGIVFEDFFPLPVFDATQLDTNTNLGINTDISLAPTDTLGITPVSITTNGSTNALRIEWPDFTTVSTQTLGVDVEITVSDDPFADNLFLTNLFRASTVNSDPVTATGLSPVQISIRAPELVITTGISASDNPTGDATINPLPATLPVDGDITASDAGDTLTFTTTVENIGGASAFNVVVTIPAVARLTGCTNVQVLDGDGTPIAFRDPADVDAPAPRGLPIPTDLSSGIKLDIPLAGNNDSPAGGGPPYSTDTAIVTYTCTLAGTVQPEEVITSQASATWASQGGAGNFPAVTNDATITIASPANAKTLTSISPGYAGNLTQAQIGEVLSYTVVITLPEGTTSNTGFTDLLDNGLAFTDVASITPSSGDVTTDAAGGFPGVLAGAVFSSSGPGTHQLDRMLTLDFATVTNANTDDATPETITIVYRARVLNWTGNTRSKVRNNQADWTWDNPNGGGTLQVGDSAPNVTLIEPSLQITKTLFPAAVDAGDVITVTLHISHTSNIDGNAFDVTLENVLPSGFTFNTDFTTNGLVPDTGPAHALGTITAGWDSFPQESTAQVIFTVTVDSTVEPTENVENCADIEWESLAAADESGLPLPPNNTLGVERTGDTSDPGSTANTYTDKACDSIYVPDAAIAKTIDAISPDGSSPDITSGDTLTYRLMVTPPEGTTSGLTLSDALPPGLSFRSAQLDTTGFNGSVSMASAVSSGLAATGQTVNITLGAVTTVTDDNNPANNSFAVLVDALVEGSEAVNDGLHAVQNKTNTVTLDYTGNGGTIQDSTGIDFAEPDLQITKLMTPDTGLDAGTEVAIRLTVSNTGTGTARDITVTDVLNDDGSLFNTTPGSVVEKTTPAGFTFGYAEPTVTYTGGVATLAAGADLVFEFTAVVRADVITGSTFNNTAAVSGDSQTGSVTGERTTNDTGTDSVTTGAASARKALTASSEAWSPGNDAAIGEVLTYQAIFNLPEGVTQASGDIVTDTLPAGLGYISGTASVRSVRDTTITAGTFTVTGWGSRSACTLDRTLRRQDTICTGDTDATDGFDPSNQWNGSSQDGFTGLDSHSVSCVVPADLIISEYVEGSGNNQALEFFNGTGGSIDLTTGNYIVEFYFDGAATAGRTINLTGTVADGMTHVLGNSAAAAGITGVSDQTEGGSWFNGNDVIILKVGGPGGTILDIIGQVAALDRIPPSPAKIVPTINNEVLEFDLGDLTNNDGDSGAEQVILEYDLLMLNTADNNRGSDKINTVRLNYLNRDGQGQSISVTETVTVVEPELSMTKSADPTSVEGGSTVTFTVVYANSGNTDVTRALEPIITDTLPAEYQNLQLTSAVLSRGTMDLSVCTSILTNTITLDTNGICMTPGERYLGPGETITLIYTADVDSNIGFEQQITNTATGSATSLPGTNGTGDTTPGAAGTEWGERDASGSVNDLQASDNSTVTAGKPTITKTGDTNLQILGTTTMTIPIDVPVGTTGNFVITDNLPSGLRYTGVLNITPPAANFTSSLTPGTPVADSDPIVLDFGTINNSAAAAQTITITYGVEVENILANQNSTSLVNTATLSYQYATMPLPSDTAVITVIEPNLEIAKTITAGAAGSDAGDTLSYQVVVTNTGTAGTAYRVNLEDVMPGALLGAPDGSGSGPFFLNITLDNDGGAVVKNAGGALVAGDASFNTTISTDDTLTWPLFDLPPGATLTLYFDAVVSNSAGAGEILTNTVTATYDSLQTGGGRNGTGGTDDDSSGILNNYRETDSATVILDSAVALQKSLNAVHSDNDFTIGELITFDIRVDLIEGVTDLVTITDVLPPGLDYEAPVRLTAGPHISTTQAAAAIEAPAGTLTIDLGDVTNTADVNETNDFLIIEVDARVLDIPGNASGNPPLMNSASLTSAVGDAGPDTQIIDITEPGLTVTKVPDNAGPALGDAVTFTVNVSHSTSNSDAFDVVLSDAIPPGLTYVAGSHTGNGTVNKTDPARPVFGLGTITLAEMSKQFTFDCRVDTDADVGVAVTNTIALSYTGQPGTPAIERSYSGSADAIITPSTGSTFIEADKTVTLSSDGGIAGVVDPTDVLTYTITLTNTGANTADTIIFTDTVPGGTTYVPASLSTSVGSANDSGAPDLLVDIGTLNVSAAATITFSVTVNPGTPKGTVISNQGFVDSRQTVPEPTDSDGVDENGDQSTNRIVDGGPMLSNGLYSEKLVSWKTDGDNSGDITSGDTMGYTVILVNRGSTALTGVTLSDTIPAGLTPVAASKTATSGTPAITGQTFTLTGASIPIGGTITVTFDVTIDAFGATYETFITQAEADSDQTDPVPSDGNGEPGDGNQPTRFIAVNGVAGVPVIDVEKRWFLAADLNGDGTTDPGETIGYKIFIQNSGSGEAANVRLNDPLPADTTIVGGSTFTSQGAVISEAPFMVNIGTLLPGQLVTITFNVTVNGGTAGGTIVSNQATVTGNGGINEPSDDNGNDGDGKNPTLTPVSDNTGIPGSPRSLVKVLENTSETGSISPDVQIGEVLTFLISVDVPAGTLREMSITDTLPTGFHYLAGSAKLGRTFDTGLQASRNPGSVNSAAGEAFVALTDGVDFTVTGQTIQLFLGDVINSDNDLNAESYMIRYQGVLTNTAGNQAGVQLTNYATVTYLNALNQPVSMTPAANSVTLIEPSLQISKTANSTTILPTDNSVQFIVAVTNPVTANSANAHNIKISDPLPAPWTSLAVDTVVPAGGITGVIDNSSGTGLDIDIEMMPPGGSVLITYTATATGPLTPGTLTNTAAAAWTSLPGNRGSGNLTPGNPGETHGERNGNGSGPNDYNAQDTADVIVSLSDGVPSMTKSLLLSSEPDSTGNLSLVGEVLTFRLAVSIPPGTTQQLVLNDSLPDGLDYIPGSARLAREFYAGLTSSVNPGSINTAPSGIYTALVDGVDVVQAGRILSVTFGDVVNSAGNRTDGRYLLEFRTIVLNALSNQSGTVLTNSGQASYDNPGAPATTHRAATSPSYAAAIVIEPDIRVTKSILETTLLSTDTVLPYRITVENLATANSAPAFELTITDTLSPVWSGLTMDDIALTGFTSGVTDNSAGTTLSITVEILPPGGQIAITYQATTETPLIPDEKITNAVGASWTSLPGSRGTADQTPGTPGGSNGERTGNGGMNDHSGSDTAAITVTIETLIPTIDTIGLLILTALLLLTGTIVLRHPS